MNSTLRILLLLCIFTGCVEEKETASSDVIDEIVFDSKKWKSKQGSDYPYREEMVNSVLYNDSIRTLTKPQIIELLGNPERTNDNHLYYLIHQRKIGMWTFKASYLVIKCTDKDSVEWIKLHE